MCSDIHGGVAANAATRPGITGLWQVRWRNNTTYRERVALDRWHVDHCSPAVDAKIIAKTPSAMAQATAPIEQRRAVDSPHDTPTGHRIPRATEPAVGG